MTVFLSFSSNSFYFSGKNVSKLKREVQNIKVTHVGTFKPTQKLIYKEGD